MSPRPDFGEPQAPSEPPETCMRCEVESLQQNAFEVQPGFWVCFHCVTDAELNRWYSGDWT